MHLIIRVRNYFNLGVHSIRIFMVDIAVNWYVSYHKNLSAKPDDHIGIVKYASFRSTDAIHKSLCIILVTFLIDSILKWGASTEVLNFFKFRFILYDPSFLGCIKILEKYPCPSCGDLTITPFFKSFSTSKFITKTYLQWYKYGALPTTILFRFTFRPLFTITKMKWSDIIFAHMLQ